MIEKASRREAAPRHGEARIGTADTAALVAPPSPAEWEALKEQAAVIVKSGLAPSSVDTPEKVIVIALKGREVRIPMMQALSHVHVIDGKPTFSAELMRALVRRSGHKIRIVEWTDEKCVMAGQRTDDPGHWQQTTYTVKEAARAGLTNKPTWRKFLQAMLLSRVTSKHCRAQFEDVLGGISYTPEELGAEVDEEGAMLAHPDVVEPASLAGEPAPAPEATEAAIEDAEEVEAAEATAEATAGILPGQVEHTEKLSWWIWGEERAVEEKALGGSRIEDLTEDGAGRLIARLEEIKGRMEAREQTSEAGSGPPAPAEERKQRGELPATRKQLNYLEALVADVVEDGVSRFEDMVGKRIKDLTREEASEWIGRLSGRAV